MIGKNYDDLDSLTAALWTSFITGLQYGQQSIPLKLNALHVAKMLELRKDAEFIINELKRDLAFVEVKERDE